jgi:general secretion pathway protein G
MIVRKLDAQLKRNIQRARRAFTLLEVLIVVAIIVMLAGGAVLIYSNVFAGAKEKKARVDIKVLKDACEMYNTNNGQWPSDLNQLTQTQPNGDRRLVPPEALLDPWGKQYTMAGADQDGKPQIYTTTPEGKQLTN